MLAGIVTAGPSAKALRRQSHNKQLAHLKKDLSPGVPNSVLNVLPNKLGTVKCVPIVNHTQSTEGQRANCHSLVKAVVLGEVAVGTTVDDSRREGPSVQTQRLPFRFTAGLGSLPS